jgi:hypothetical protein
VILLHRLSQDASLRIPENEIGILNLVKKYLQKGNERLRANRWKAKCQIELEWGSNVL